MSSLRAALFACLAAVLGCNEPESLPPFGEVRVVLDTDVDVERLSARLQIDVYDENETWTLSRALQRSDPRGWPSSFTLTGPTSGEPRKALLRVRLFPDGKVRDYRGERFFPAGFLDDPEACLPLFPPEFGERQQKLLFQTDEDGEALEPVVVADEPEPGVTIDRLVAVELVPGELRELRLELRGACMGAQADFGPSPAPGDEQSCSDGSPRLEQPSIGETSLAPPKPSPPIPSRVASFPAAAPCTAPPRQGGFQSFEDEVCIDGGLFVLGDPAVFGSFPFGALPERGVVLEPFRIDRFEVTVGRFRSALLDGLLPDVTLPVANDGPLLFDPDDDASSCTFTTEHGDREDYPLSCVTWQTARAFCLAMGGDLPSEAQWEYAAAAAGRPRETRYAWGSSLPTCERAVFARAPAGVGAGDCAIDSADIGLQPLRENEAESGDRALSDVVGMAGSLREMTRDASRPYCSACWVDAALENPVCDAEGSGPRVLRGGDWASDVEALLVGTRDEGLDLGEWSPRAGFRCVRPGVDSETEDGS